LVLAAAVAATIATSALATDIIGVQPAALDQPRINGYVARNPAGPPLIADLGGGVQTFNITAFFDTGASGILLSPDTSELLGVATTLFNSEPVIFSDVGVGGTSDFLVSEPLHVGLARFHPDADVDNLETYQTVYNQTYGPMRTQIGPINVEPDPILQGLDVFGTPLMANKVFVMDPKPVNTFVDTMRTYVYNPGTPFNKNTADTDPGIPTLNNPETSRHIRLSQGSFERFTETNPPGAPMPTLFENPFIGPNPVRQLEPNPPPDDTPPVKVAFDGLTRTGSFLFDTGAAASIISEGMANGLNVFIDESQQNNPVLRDEFGTALPDQFQLTVGGTGGTIKVPGFFLDSMLVKTMEGNPNDDNDPKHIRFQGAPVLVFDISLEDPVTHQQLTLDGVFGMNYLVASAFVTEAEPFPIISDLTYGAFDWVVYDHNNGTVGLELAPPRPPQIPLLWIGDIEPTANWDFTSEIWLDPDTFAFRAYADGDYVLFTNQVFATTVNVVEPVTPGEVIFDNSNQYNYTLTGAPIQGFGGLTKQGNGTLTLSNQNTYKGTTDIRAGTIVFAARQDIGLVGVRAQGVAQINTSQTFEGLDVAGGRALVAPGGNKVLVLGSVEVTNNGTIDLTDNAMIVDKNQTSLDEVRALIVQGRGDNTWTGSGIKSSTAATNPARFALGMADNAVLNRTTFLGEPVGGDDVLIRYTRTGDANLDAVVNLQDFNRLASNFGVSSGAYWHQADFNYDGRVNLQDFNLLAANFGLSVAGPGVTPEDWAALARAVPEPGALAAFGVAASVAACGRRRRGGRDGAVQAPAE
jgi:autotransporter-associated beta strand protein